MSARKDFPDDEGLVEVLTSLGIRPQALLGHGGEAWVYALDEQRVVRVLHERCDPAMVPRRQALVDELASHGAPFGLPEVLDVGDVGGRHYVLERRLPGRSVLDSLAIVEGAERDRLVAHHLDAAAVLGHLHLDERGWFGDLIAPDPVRTETWPAFLEARAAASLMRSSPEFHAIDAAVLADGLPDPVASSFVHLDAFAGNMLAEGDGITAVIDIGNTSVVGDARLDPVSAVVYLCSPQITPVATARDRDVAMSWLRAAGLADLYEPAGRWLAAYWSSALDDHSLHRWCRSVLLDSPP